MAAVSSSCFCKHASEAMLGPSCSLLFCACRKCKLYRFDNDSGEWKERGAGQVRLLQSQDNGKIRLLMRQEKTLKIRANHFGEALPYCCSLGLQPGPALRHACCWHIMK